MPVTIKLSQKLYEKLGEDVANELVDWFNQVDATYRGDLREINEVNFGRFDAKLEQRLTELDAKWGGRWTELDAKLEQRLAQLKGELGAQLEKLRGDTTAAIAQAQSATVRWMFTFWAPTAIGIVGTAGGVVALLLRR